MRLEHTTLFVLGTLLVACDSRHGAPGVGATASTTSPAAPPASVVTPAASVLPTPREVRPVILPGRVAKQLTLRCSVRATPTQLEVSYTATNEAPEDAYVLDLSQQTRPDRSGFDVEVRPIYLSWLGGTSAHLGQGIAPLPPDRDVYARSIPMATRVLPGASLARIVVLPLPLAELGPYDAAAPAGPDAPSIDRLVITLSALRPSFAGFHREEVAGHPGAFRAATKSTVIDVERARCEVAIPRTSLQIFRWEEAHGPSFQRAE